MIGQVEIAPIVEAYGVAIFVASLVLGGAVGVVVYLVWQHWREDGNVDRARQAQMTEQQQTIGVLIANQQALADTNKQAVQTIAKWADTCDAATKQLNELVEQMGRERTQYQSEIATLNEQHRKDREAWNKERTQLRNDYDALALTVSRMQAQVSALEAEKKQLRAERDAARAESATYKRTTADQQQQIDTLRQKITALEKKDTGPLSELKQAEPQGSENKENESDGKRES